MKDTHNTSDQSERVVSSITLKPVTKWLVPFLVNLISVPAVLTVLGFFVVHSYLASFTTLFTFNISVTQYLAAGINLILGVGGWMVSQLMLFALNYGFWFCGLIVFFIMIGVFRASIAQKRFVQKNHRFFRRSSQFLKSLYRGYLFVIHLFFILVLLIFVLVYGWAFYSQSPRMIGGGQAADIILIFKEAQSPQNSGWPFPINSALPTQSQPVQFLLELTNGVLVRYGETGNAVIVKNDVLQGIMEVMAVPMSPVTPPLP